MNQPVRISVVGAHTAPETELEAARIIGRLLAERGCVLITGGLGGL